MNHKIHKTDEEWQQQLSPEQYQVTRQGGTERAFSGQYYDHKAKGTYHCICCQTPLFRSTEKFNWGGPGGPVSHPLSIRRPSKTVKIKVMVWFGPRSPAQDAELTWAMCSMMDPYPPVSDIASIRLRYISKTSKY